MPTPNLTPLRRTSANEPGISLTLPDRAGQWIPLGGSLKELADALDVSDDAAVDVVRSTPDPWAQVRTFADALLFPDRIMPPVEAQWRGLIALFALKDRYEDIYRLQFQPVPLAPDGSRLARILTQLLPGRLLPVTATGLRADWSNPVVVSLLMVEPNQRDDAAGEPIAVLNPASLLAPGRDVARRRIATIPWWRDGLSDPAALPAEHALPIQEMQILKAWIEQLEKDLVALAGGALDHPVLRRLRERLQAFAADCADPVRQPGVADHPLALDIGEPQGDGLPQLYRVMRRPMLLAEPAPGTSDCVIPLRADLGDNPPFQGLVLLDPAIATSLGRTANRVMLWGRTTLAKALTGGPAVRAALRREIAEANYLLVEPGDFFTDVLVRLNIDRKEGLVKDHPARLQDMLAPLSPLALLVAGPEALRQQLDRDADHRVTLKLPLRGAGGRLHALARTYASSPADGQGRIMNQIDWAIGDVALWPDFRSPRWHRYFARVTFPIDTEQRLRGRFAGSGRMLADMLNGLDATHRDEDFRPWLAAQPFEGRRDRIPALAERFHRAGWGERFRGKEYDKVVVEVQSATAPFEAVFYSVIPGPGAAAVPAGMVLLAVRDAKQPAANAGVIAVDFGTTNTVAAIDSERPAALGNRILHPIWSQSQRMISVGMTQIEKNFQDFLPPAVRQLPTPTVVIGREVDGEGERLLAGRADGTADLAEQILVGNLIYFQPTADGSNTVGNLQLEDWRTLLMRTRFNLKWSNDPEDRRAARHYLRQLIMMLAAEAVDHGLNPDLIRWRFSRPERMRGEREFRDLLRLALAEAMPQSTPRLDRLQSEGLAAANYILISTEHQAFTRRQVNVILDIGGGTTDIAIWNNAVPTPKLIWSGAIRLAGGDFFTSHIIRNPDILRDDLLGLGQWFRVLQPEDGDGQPLNPDKLKYVGELLFSGPTLGDAIDRRWTIISGADAATRLKETAFLFLAGVAWHVGRALGVLIRQGRVPESDLASIAVALCGRGSGLFARLHGPDSIADTDVSAVLRLIAAGAGVASPAQPSVFVSPSPKIEVVAGMIRESLIETALPGDEPADPGLLPTPDVVAAHVAEGPANDDNEIDLFLDALARAAGFRVRLTAAQREALGPRVQDNARKDKAAGNDPLPEFIGALKVLVSFMIQPAGHALRPDTRWS